MRQPEVVLGVGGGIAAYKACELLRRFTESGHHVRVVPTAAALHFVGAATWAALSGEPVATEVWEEVHQVPHVRLGKAADLVVVAPATADVLSRAATGRADDLLTNVLLTARCPVVFVPAMHTEMWEHPATRENVATLRRRGALVVEPASGRLTGADTGKGRLPEPEAVFELCRAVLARAQAAVPPDAGEPGAGEPGARPAGPGPAFAAWHTDLAGRHVVVSAGGTREPIDPVRFLGNHSSGKQGYALARAALARGARVTLVSANSALPDPAGAEVIRVGTAEELAAAVTRAAAEADAVVMAAAVADFRPAARARQKIKKVEGREPEPIALVRNPDILAALAAARRPGQVIAGFAAETEDVLANGQAKLARKGCDLLVVNRVGEGLGFGTEENEAVILEAGGGQTHVPRGPKEVLAHRIWDVVLRRLGGVHG